MQLAVGHIAFVVSIVAATVLSWFIHIPLPNPYLYVRSPVFVCRCLGSVSDLLLTNCV